MDQLLNQRDLLERKIFEQAQKQIEVRYREFNKRKNKIEQLSAQVKRLETANALLRTGILTIVEKALPVFWSVAFQNEKVQQCFATKFKAEAYMKKQNGYAHGHWKCKCTTWNDVDDDLKFALVLNWFVNHPQTPCT